MLGLATLVATLLRFRARACVVLACLVAMLCATTNASALEHAQTKTRVWDFSFSEPLNTRLDALANSRTHPDFSPARSELASVSLLAAEGATAAIRTPYALEAQSLSTEAQAALSEVRGGASVFRTGELGQSMAGESQYWSLSSPLSPGYGAQMGVPGVAPDFIMGGTVSPGAAVITNEAAALGANAGGGIQVVTSPGGVTGLWFHMP